MARRGVMTALQAALAGIGGAAGGYVQQQEMKRKQLEEERERKRQEQRDLITFGREAITPGPLATRAPAGLPAPDMPTGAPPSAVPMPTGKVDFGGAMRQLEQEEAVPSGTEAIEIGGRTLYIPVGQRYRDIKRSEELQAEQSALDAAIARARAEGQVKREFGEEDFQTTNKRDFDTFKALGGRGEYKPNVVYSRMITDLGADKALAGQLRLVGARTAAAGAGGTGGTGASGQKQEGRGPLPNISNIATELGKMTVDDVKKLRPSGIAAAVQAPLIMAESRGGIGSILSFPASAALNVYANANEQRYAQMVRAVTDAVARASERGVLTDRDIARFQGQVSPLPGDENETVSNKFETLKAWSKWLDSASKNYANVALRAPGESDEEYAYRMSQARINGVDMSQLNQDIIRRGGIDPELEEDRRLWDASVTKYGLARTKRELGDRP